jgi:hypothetical protein
MARGFTQDEQAIVAQWLHDELTAAGIIPESARIAIVEGSRTYGRCWYVAVIPADRSGHHVIPGIGDLRTPSASECRMMIRTVVNALQSARRVREGDDYMTRQFAGLNVEEVTA